MRLNDPRRRGKIHDDQQIANAVRNSGEQNKRMCELRSQGGVRVDWDEAIKRVRRILDETTEGMS